MTENGGQKTDERGSRTQTMEEEQVEVFFSR